MAIPRWRTASRGRPAFGRTASMRTFDPCRLGAAECDAWVGYYRRRWFTVLSAAVRMVRVGFGMSWPTRSRCLAGVAREPALGAVSGQRARRGPGYMRRFYALVARATARRTTSTRPPGWRSSGGGCTGTCSATPRTRTEDARRRAHRALRPRVRGRPGDGAAGGGAAGRGGPHLRPLGRRRLRPRELALPVERALLVRSYAALLAAVHR